MFGPNTHLEWAFEIAGSHRDSWFFDLYERTATRFQTAFDLGGYDVLFIPGSGTVGVEAVVSSLRGPIHIAHEEGVFTNRWRSLCATHRTEIRPGEASTLGCHLETSLSEHRHDPFDIVDAISSFPYLRPHSDAKVIITSTNKQLGSLVGLSIVCVRKDCWHLFEDDSRFSYLNLARYRTYAGERQTPSTTPTHAYQHLMEVLDTFEQSALESRIDAASDAVVDAIGESNVIGERRCPVITFPRSAVSDRLAEEWDLYGHALGKENLQVFTYSCAPSAYVEFAEAIRSAG